jgi:hypothetical protein
MLLLVMSLGVVPVSACAIGRECSRCKHTEYRRRQKKAHELTHTDISLFCSEGYVSVFAVRRPQ